MTRTFMTTRLMIYLRQLPRTLPPDHVLAHNVLPMQPTQRLSVNGFRAWLTPTPADPQWLQPCRCGWAPHLGAHYRLRPR
jgi:hypothetical protein